VRRYLKVFGPASAGPPRRATGAARHIGRLLVRAYVQAHLIAREALTEAQEKCDPLMALSILKQAFTTDVTAILAVARERAGGAIDPITAYRASGYRQRKAEERPETKGAAASGIV
jgi:L-rhamnose isomerase/sugar isomerase